MTAEEARAFNPWNMLRAAPDGKVDDWDPAGVRAKYENDGSDVFRMGLTAASYPEARGASCRRRSVGDPFANTEPPGNASIRTGGPGVTLTATVQPHARGRLAVFTGPLRSKT